MSTDITVFNDDQATQGMFLSYQPTGEDAQKIIFNAINSPDKTIKECVNQVINMVDCLVLPVELVSSETGELQSTFRTVIFDSEGVSYQASAQGIATSLATLKRIYGTLHFPNGLQIKPKEVKTPKGFTLVLELV